MVCTFIGHRDAPHLLKPILKQVLKDLIENKNVNVFYIGNQGNFDCIARQCLKELKKIYNINYYVVLAYMPAGNKTDDYSDTVYLDEISNTPYKYRIIERNKWMIKRSDIVIAYCKYPGNTREFRDIAKKQNKTIIDLEID